MSESFTYMVYDIESAINKPLLNKVLFSGENLTDDQAYKKHLEDLLEKEGRDFVNPAFHKPISIGAVALAEDYSITRIGLLGEEPRTTGSIVRAFWDIFNNKYPVLIDFNGKGYDIRLMELWAFQLGITIKGNHFKKFGGRYRYNEENHIDLHEFLTNHQSIRFRGGLNLFSKLLGKPGKMGTSGDQVQALFEAGEHFRIDDYCLSDAMDTYFVFLRSCVMRGSLSLEREKELVGQARQKMEEKRNQEGYFKDYLEAFGEWVPEA